MPSFADYQRKECHVISLQDVEWRHCCDGQIERNLVVPRGCLPSQQLTATRGIILVKSIITFTTVGDFVSLQSDSSHQRENGKKDIRRIAFCKAKGKLRSGSWHALLESTNTNNVESEGGGSPLPKGGPARR